MSTAVSELRIQQNPQTSMSQAAQLEFVATGLAPTIQEEKFADPHPLLPVFIAGAIAFVLSGAFVGSIVAWLLLRYSGVMGQ